MNVLKNRDLTDDLDKHVNVIGRKISQTDGMQISATGILYYGQLSENAVNQYDIGAKMNFVESQQIFYQNQEFNQWPDSFSMCDKGWLWWTSNRLQNFLNNLVDLSLPNYHVLAKEASGKSYQYFEDGSHPELPIIDTEM